MTELVAEAVRVRLGGRERLVGASARFGRGWTAVVGPNGAGKSTLLRALAGLVRPSAGRVLLDGEDLAGVSAAERARRLGWLGQGGEVTGELDVRETVALGRIAHHGLFGRRAAGDAEAVDRAMARCGCTGWAGRALGSLSGGERQRVLVARALATEAPALLLDEPTAHLDAPHQVGLARLFRELAGRCTLVTVLHDLPVALAADRVVVVVAGAVAAEGAVGNGALHRAIERAFDGAVRVEPDASGRPRARLALDALDALDGADGVAA